MTFPADWYWIAGDGPDGQAWHSAVGGYVAATDADPERTTRIIDEVELTDVLRLYGLSGPRPTAEDVRAEAQRRIIALTGATTLTGCMIKQLNANMRANELNNTLATGGTLSAAEAAEASALQAMATAVKAIRAASNVIEAAPPTDYRDDSHWPPTS